MRIGVNAFPLAYEKGGARYAMLGWLEGLLRVRPQVTIEAFVTAIGSPLLEAIAGDRLRVRRIRHENQILEARGDFDLYFAPLNYMVPLLGDRPSVAVLHDIQERFLPEHFTRAELEWRQDNYPDMCRSATRVVTSSRASAAAIIEAFAVEAEKVRVVPLSPQPGLLEAPPIPIPRPQASFFFTPANFHRHKNHALLLDALCLLRQRRPRPTSIIFAGAEVSGGYPLRDEIAQRGLGETCRIVGGMSAGQMRFCYENALATVLPTRYEGFGMPAVEAMALGCPLVLSDLPVLREVAQDAAVRFDPSNAAALADLLERIEADGDLRAELASRGRRIAEQFTLEQSVRRLLDVFDEAQRAFGDLRIDSPAPRLGIMITGSGSPAALERSMASTRRAGIRLAVRRLGPRATSEELLRFALDGRLDLVSELAVGDELAADAAAAVAAAYVGAPRVADGAVMGEVVVHHRGGRMAISRLRRTGDDLWNLQSHLYPPMFWLSPDALQQAVGGDWRWRLLRRLRHRGRLTIVRRILAEVDAAGEPLWRRAMAIVRGQRRYYRVADERLQPVPPLRYLEPLAKSLSRLLPLTWQHAGTRLWYCLAR